MKINYLGKSRLSVVIVLSAASVAFAQKTRVLSTQKRLSKLVLARWKFSTCSQRAEKLPVAISTIKATEILEKFSN